jgi:hypothetical protein
MHNTCVQICAQVVGRLGEVLGKLYGFSSQVFVNAQHLVLKVGLVHNLSTSFTHSAKTYTQKFNHHHSPYFYLLLPIFHRTYYYY